VRKKTSKIQKTLAQLNSVSKYHPTNNEFTIKIAFNIYFSFCSLDIWDEKEIDSFPASSMDQLTKEMLTLLGFIYLCCYY
jgi:hypothetical protein